MVFRQTPEWHEQYKAKRARECAAVDQPQAGETVTREPHKLETSRSTREPASPVYPLVNLCRLAGLPEPTPEHRFHPVRKWRADYAFLFTTPRVLVEIDGGAWTQGRHTRGAGFIEDQRKLNAAALLGFAVLRYTPDRLAECIADLRLLFAKEAA